mmetsp:Transcript_58245/g.136478  ORF Transcript_58245/g.136478 Transcript_58245/m.136478 type:complete len:269 (+) Transcript_58245:399-1205(+)
MACVSSPSVWRNWRLSATLRRSGQLSPPWQRGWTSWRLKRCLPSLPLSSGSWERCRHCKASPRLSTACRRRWSHCGHCQRPFIAWRRRLSDRCLPEWSNWRRRLCNPFLTESTSSRLPQRLCNLSLPESINSRLLQGLCNPFRSKSISWRPLRAKHPKSCRAFAQRLMHCRQRQRPSLPSRRPQNGSMETWRASSPASKIWRPGWRKSILMDSERRSLPTWRRSERWSTRSPCGLRKLKRHCRAWKKPGAPSGMSHASARTCSKSRRP